jgi:hypothetical protein
MTSTDSLHSSFLTKISAVVLVGTEVLGLALCLGWALGGLLELSPTITYSLMGVFTALGLWVMGLFIAQVRRHA